MYENMTLSRRSHFAYIASVPCEKSFYGASRWTSFKSAIELKTWTSVYFRKEEVDILGKYWKKSVFIV